MSTPQPRAREADMRFFSLATPPRHLGLAVVMGVALVLSFLIHGVPLAWAQAGQPSNEPKRPAYQIGSAGRFNEDWSVLRGVDLDTTDDFRRSQKSSVLSRSTPRRLVGAARRRPGQDR